MYCKHCSKEIDDNSTFCKWCGKAITEYTIGTYNYAPNAPNSVPPISVKYTAPPKNKRGPKLTGAMILFLVIFFSVIFIYFATYDSNTSTDAGTTASVSAVPSFTDEKSASSAPEKSEYERNMDSEFDSACVFSESAIKRIATFPQTVHLNSSRDSFKADGVFFNCSGNVTFKDSSGNLREDDFEYSYMTNGVLYLDLRLKIGDSTFYDYRSYINKNNGVIQSSNYVVDNRSYGQTALTGSIKNSDNWSKPIAVGDGKMSLSEFYKIENGMDIDEVLEIVGGGGVILADSDMAGYRTVIVGWDGIGSIGANASVTFQNGKVIAKAQAGLR